MTAYRFAIAITFFALIVTAGAVGWQCWVRNNYVFRIWFDEKRLHFTGWYDQGALSYRSVSGYARDGDRVDENCTVLLRLDGRDISAHDISVSLMQELGAAPTYESGSWQVWGLRSKPERWHLSASFNSGSLWHVFYSVDPPDAHGEGETETKISIAIRQSDGNICDRCRLPPDAIPGALVTPDGMWHDLADFGWRMVDEPCEANRKALREWTARCNELMSAYEHCWVVEVWTHS